jgi:hypothetical protein
MAQIRNSEPGRGHAECGRLTGGPGRGESPTHWAHEPAGRVGGLHVGRTDRRALAKWGPLTSDDSDAGYAARDTDTWAMGLHRSLVKGEARAQPGGWGLLARGSKGRARANARERLAQGP